MKGKNPGNWYNTGMEAGKMGLLVIRHLLPCPDAPPKNNMKGFPEATKINVCSWGWAPSSGTAPLLRLGILSSLWSPSLRGTCQLCSSFMYKMGQGWGQAAIAAGRAFSCTAQGGFCLPRPRGSSCSCLTAHPMKRRSVFWWLSMRDAQRWTSWDGGPNGKQEAGDFLSPDFSVYAPPPTSLLVTTFSVSFRSLMIPCTFSKLFPAPSPNKILWRRSKKTVTDAHYWWECKPI